MTKNSESKLIPLTLFFIVSILFLSPILANINNWGAPGDWDSHLFTMAVPRKILLTYHQFPLWNPYHCGGNVMLAHPESLFLSPFFLPILFFGNIVGVKIQILLYSITGMFGMFILSKKLGLKKYSCYLPSFVFMLSSWYALRVTEGHTVFFPITLFPYLFYFYISSLDRWRFVLPAALFLTLIFFSGGVYPSYCSVLFLFIYAGIRLLKDRALVPVKMCLLVLVFTGFLSAVKTLPTVEFMMQNPRETHDTQHTSYSLLYRSLFSRDQGVMSQADLYPNQNFKNYNDFLEKFWGGKRPWGWHEYGAFIGMGVLILYLIGFFHIRELWDWYVTSIILFLLALGYASPINLWGLLHLLPVAGSLHGSSRIMMMLIFSIALISGFVLSKFETRKPDFNLFGRFTVNRGRLVLGIITLICLELITVSRPVLKDAFTKKPIEIEDVKEGFRQIKVSDPFNSNYVNVILNQGIVNCYESGRLPLKASPAGDDQGRQNPYYRGEVYLLEGKGTAKMVDFSPNRITVEVNALAEEKLVLNQNYFKGWNVNVGVIAPSNGLVATKVAAGRSEIVFFYSMPLSMKIGLVLTITTILAMVWLWKQNKYLNFID